MSDLSRSKLMPAALIGPNGTGIATGVIEPLLASHAAKARLEEAKWVSIEYYANDPEDFERWLAERIAQLEKEAEKP